MEGDWKGIYKRIIDSHLESVRIVKWNIKKMSRGIPYRKTVLLICHVFSPCFRFFPFDFFYYLVFSIDCSKNVDS